MPIAEIEPALAPERACAQDRIDLDRRDFVRAAVGTGFAAAVMPVTAQAIKTDSTGLTVGEITIQVGHITMPAYRALPEGKTGLPVDGWKRGVAWLEAYGVA